MGKPSIDQVWERIRKLAGEEFRTKEGLPLTYSIDGDTFTPSRTDYAIPKGDFAKALELVPFFGPGAINELVRGPSYIWAVLHDKRVRQGDW